MTAGGGATFNGRSDIQIMRRNRFKNVINPKNGICFWFLNELRSIPVLYLHGRLVSTEKRGRATLLLMVLVLMGDVGDVLCPSGRAEFSPNPRAPRQGTPRLLITRPPAGSSTVMTSCVRKHTDHCHKKTSTHTTSAHRPQGAGQD